MIGLCLKYNKEIDLLRRIVCVLLFFALFVSCIFPTDNSFDFNEYKKEGEAVIISLAAAYLNKPKIELKGVEFTSGKGLLPTKVKFSSSDISSYYESLSNPDSSSFLGFLSSLTSSISPLISKALEALSECDLSQGDFILDGSVDFEGGDNLGLSTLLFGSDFSGISILVEGSGRVSGKENFSVSFNIRCIGDANRVLFVYFDSLVIDGNAIFIQPLMISLKIM